MSTTLTPSIGDCATTAAKAVTVACPDARPPAYQAAVGLARVGCLENLLTSFYYNDQSIPATLGRRAVPSQFARLEKRLSRRQDPEIPVEKVRAFPAFDMALAVEKRAGSNTRHALARWRTRRFDRTVRRELRTNRPDAALVFSDVGSEFTLPYCREAGISSILSMVHGDVREERQVLEREQNCSPDFFPIYLGDGPVDHRELGWLHDRRLRDLEFADHVLVPSDHIALQIIARGTPAERVSVVPYAADVRRFVPARQKRHDDSCFFLFAGGITQRKGIKYLLEAWRMIRRPGWRLGLLGGLPRNSGSLEPFREEVEFLGQVGHSEMPNAMAHADVFVFPSLFEGSAVVTYEALACGLPCVVTSEAGSVVREGFEGFVVEAAAVESLAAAMERLGNDHELRAEFAASARLRAMDYSWERYHLAIAHAVGARV